MLKRILIFLYIIVILGIAARAKAEGGKKEQSSSVGFVLYTSAS